MEITRVGATVPLALARLDVPSVASARAADCGVGRPHALDWKRGVSALKIVLHQHMTIQEWLL